jgi:hypothetical protein
MLARLLLPSGTVFHSPYSYTLRSRVVWAMPSPRAASALLPPHNSKIRGTCRRSVRNKLPKRCRRLCGIVLFSRTRGNNPFEKPACKMAPKRWFSGPLA